MQAKGYNYRFEMAKKLGVLFNIDKLYNYNYDSNECKEFIDKLEGIDPDTCGCKELYDDFIEAFFSDECLNKQHGIKIVKNVEQQYDGPPFYTIFVNGDDYYVSIDYIGPSVYWARKSGISDVNLIKFLNVCRTIGGHIAWPRKINEKEIQGGTINQARGGKEGLYDRIDWTIVLVKIYYETIKDSIGKEEFIEMAMSIDDANLSKDKDRNQAIFNRMYKAFYYSNSWFELFGAFEGFCEQFKLIGENGFVSNNYEVKQMAPWFPFLPEDYANYIDNVCVAVNTRNNMIFNS